MLKRKPQVMTPEEQEVIRTKDFLTAYCRGPFAFSLTIILSVTATGVYGQSGSIRHPRRNGQFCHSWQTEMG